MLQISQKYLVAVRDPHPEDLGIKQARDWFSHVFGCCVSTNLYMSGAAESVGFVEHHDGHDVFALQLHGVKRWYVGPPTVSAPSHRYARVDDHSSPQHDMKLYETRSGQLLYIPLGWRHYAVAGAAEAAGAGALNRAGVRSPPSDVSGPVEARAPELASAPAPTPAPAHEACSVHLTMGLQLPRWVDAVESAAHIMGAWRKELREPLPAMLVAHESVVSVGWDVGELPAMLRKLADMVEEEGSESNALRTACGAILGSR
jgi:hypothetical protein